MTDNAIVRAKELALKAGQSSAAWKCFKDEACEQLLSEAASALQLLFSRNVQLAKDATLLITQLQEMQKIARTSLERAEAAEEYARRFAVTLSNFRKIKNIHWRRAIDAEARVKELELQIALLKAYEPHDCNTGNF